MFFHSPSRKSCIRACSPLLVLYLQISYAAVSPALSDKKAFPRFLRTISPDHLINPAKIAAMKLNGWRRVATIHETFPLFSKVRHHSPPHLRAGGGGNEIILISRKRNNIARKRSSRPTSRGRNSISHDPSGDQ